MAATLIDILRIAWPDRGVVCYGGDYETLYSPDGDEIPSLAEIDAARPAVEAALAAAAAAPPVPTEVTMSQFRRALRSASIDPNAIANSLVNDPDALDQWEYSATVRRAHPLVNAMAQQIGKTSGEVDAIFIYAATL